MKIYLDLVLVAAAGIHALEQSHVGRTKGGRPNIVVILTDDQDVHLESLDYMPLLKKHITDHGTLYKRHYCSTAICCPSRVTLWTGRNAHNTNVTDVVPPYGGYPKFVAQGFNENWLPVWLQDAGYSTFYTGKLFNAHTVDNWNSPHPAGWTSSDFLLDPFTYSYLNSTFQRNEHRPVSHEGEYSTDVLAEKAYGLLQEGIDSKRPFFLTVAPIAPHSDVKPFPSVPGGAERVRMTAPIPAERHKHLFSDAMVPRTANFNPDQPGGASWIKQLAQLTDEVVEYNDGFYRARLQALQAVDELVANLVHQLDDNGILDNTYIIYSADNGYHISQHRLNPGKECGFEEDINVPLIIRGPDVPVGEASIVTAHTDIAPTILKLAGAKTGWDGLDGSPIPLNQRALEEAREEGQEHVNIEFWGRGIPEGTFGFSLDDGKEVFYGLNNTYKALRLIGPGYNLYYSVWCTNEHELYDLDTDPGQINNLYPSSTSQPETAIFGLPHSKILPRLDALLMVTKSCKAETCIDPWSVIHREGDVRTLGDALARKFDSFYASIAPRVSVSFERCELGYIVESEGPQQAIVFEPGTDYRIGNGDL
ncbi:hypothetical protein JHW43_005200 [Diplocarpon mali]|nr:hypothetical protein JHW43_005200 [Diplocarpon mali]